MYHRILSVPPNILMNLNNVVGALGYNAMYYTDCEDFYIYHDCSKVYTFMHMYSILCLQIGYEFMRTYR